MAQRQAGRGGGTIPPIKGSIARRDGLAGVRPRGRTGLGFDFDLLPGVVIFELRGA
jgi:hypothetical protein